MRFAPLHATALAALLWWSMRPAEPASAGEPPCPSVPDDATSPKDDAARPGSDLLYRRTFLGDEALRAPWIELRGVEVPIERTQPGHGVVVRAAAGGSLRIAPEAALPMALVDRVLLSVSAPTAMAVEFELVDASNGARTYRRLALAQGAQLITIPIADLHYDRGRVALPSRSTRWGLRFVDGGELELRALEFRGDHQLGADDRELATLRDDFDEPERVRMHRRGAFVVLTDAPQLDARAVLDAIDAMERRTRGALPSMPVPRRAVPLLVFADDAGYRRFWQRLSARAGVSVVPRSQDEGYTWMGIASASYSDEYGAVRPTYVHEAHHALLERSYGLAAQRSWLFEGLAVLEQLAVSRQDLTPVYHRGLRRADAASHVHDLVTGQPISNKNYWQAAMLVQWLLADPGRAAALDATLLEMAARGSTDLVPLAPRYFGADVRALGREFWTWAWQQWG